MPIIKIFELEEIPGLGAFFYNALAAKGFTYLYHKIAEEIVAEIKSGKILDIGSGPGYLAIEIARLNSQLEIIGIDLSHKMIDIARKNAATSKIGGPEGGPLDCRIKFEVADAHNLPYPNNSFDFVCSTFSLHHWRCREKVFNECSRVVKNGGLVWIYDFRRDATKKEIRKTIGANGTNFRHFYLTFSIPFHGLKTDEYFSGEMREAIEKNGFAVLKIEKQNAMVCIKLER